jgi:hypothetical protein
METEKEPYIISAFKKLNQSLEALNNEVIVMDFSHFSPNDKTKQNYYDIHFKSLASTEDYKSKYSNYVRNFFSDSASIWRKFEKGKQKFLYNFDNSNSENDEYEKGVYLNDNIDKSNVIVQKDFNAIPHLVNDFPKISFLPGKCFIIYAEEHGYAQSIVYVLLKEKIPIGSSSEEQKDLLRKMPENLKDFDTELYSLLIHEMVNSLVEEKGMLNEQVLKYKSQTMFSLTTHSLKTHLNTTLLKEVNAFSDELESYPKLKEKYDKYVKKEVHTLFRLTEILSLVDKMQDEKKITDTAKGGTLLSESIVYYNLKEHLDKFNKRKNLERAEFDIKICSTVDLESFILPVNIYALFLGKDLIELFFNTIFENIVAYGKVESGYRNLVIDTKKDQIIFSNRTLNKKTQLDETKLTGNYGLFKKLFEDTNSGSLSIHLQIDYEFKIIISYGK